MPPIWTDIIAGAAFLLSGLALILSHRSNKRSLALQEQQIRFAGEQTDLQRRQTETQEQVAKHDLWLAKKVLTAERRADVVPTLYRYSDTEYRILLRNEGKGPAHNVDISFVGVASPLDEEEAEKTLPIKKLRPGKDVSLFADVYAGVWPPWDVIVTWTDIDDTARREEHTIQAPT